MYALLYGHPAIAEKLIPLCGARINVKDLQGKTALFYAVEKGNANVVRELLRKGARFGDKEQIGLALEAAAVKGH
jgi:ankyrin repeat protein